MDDRLIALLDRSGVVAGPADDPYLLLEDLGATHLAPTDRGPDHRRDGLPDEADQRAVITTLARLNAYGWEHP